MSPFDIITDPPMTIWGRIALIGVGILGLWEGWRRLFRTQNVILQQRRNVDQMKTRWPSLSGIVAWFTPEYIHNRWLIRFTGAWFISLSLPSVWLGIFARSS
jgi:hypothetical protein